jgi:hypothetical protein
LGKKRRLIEMYYSPDLMNRAKQFWYEFDKRYNDPSDPDVIQLYLDCNLYKPNPITNGRTANLDWMFHLLRDKIRVDPLNYEQLFLIELSRYKNGIERFAREQAEAFHRYFADSSEIQQALELFGQGVLYNEKRGYVHKMQGIIPNLLVGYSRWHGFVRAAVCVGQDHNFWLNLDRSLLLGFLLQADLKPLDTKRDNPYMSEDRLTEYQSHCMSLDFKKLDQAFMYLFPSL